MNRRILLIDADPGFHQTLTDTLSRYAFDVVNEADPEQALLLAGAEAPALLVVGVDEPDKLGFKVFQKCKKGGLAKVPIMLVTSSVSAESFAKHRGLKTHADEYLDKRTVSRDALLATIGTLIELGEPLVEDSLDIPLEIDDIQMGDEGDMVLEEEIGGDAAGEDFGDDPHSAHSIGGAALPVEDPHVAPAESAASPRRVDSMVDADIEDAFGGMLGDDYVEPTAEPAPVEEPVEEPIPELIGAAAIEADAVPEPMEPGTIPPPFREDPEPSMIGAPVIDDVAEESVEEGVPSAIPDGEVSAPSEFEFKEEPTRGPADFDEVAAEMRASDRAEPVATADPSDSDFESEEAPVAQVPEPEEQEPEPERTRITHGYESSPAIQLDDLDLQPLDESALEEIPVEEIPVPEPVPEPEPEPPPPPIVAAPQPARPKFIESSTGTNIGAAPAPVAVTERPSAPSTRISGVLNVVDLGLDRIAEDADRNQSGLHDRRELRTIHELERQITQLKAEVERTRTESTSRPAGREGEFLKLRENLLNQQKDLSKAKDEIASRDRELADLRERMGHIQQIKAELEAKSTELEQRRDADESRVAAAEARERVLGAQLATVQHELTAKTQHAEHAETVRNQLERDVANERALRASSASDAERSLRVEREQMIARHQGELITLRSDAATAQEQAIEAFRIELETAHAAAVSAAADAGRREIAIEAEAAVSQLEQRQAADLKRLEDDHAAALAQMTAEIQRLGDESAGKISRLTGERDAAIAKARADAEVAIEEARASIERVSNELKAEQAAELGRMQADASGQVVAASAANDRALAELRGEVARVQAALQQAAANHAEELQKASANQAAALAEQAALHHAALAKREKETVAARDAEAVANAAALAELREELAVQKEAADRELAEFRTALQAAKNSMEEAALNAATERSAADQAHAADVADRTAQHERALAVVNGEVVRTKAVGDAEHGRAMAAKEAEHKAALVAKDAEIQRATAELTAERDEMRKGLSGSRETHKRTEGELATAVQTIADRNSELRTHAQAITDRDQRIAELRKEIETVEAENASYQEQVLRAYQKIKTDEAMVARAKKAMAIALTVLDDQGQPKES